jgi:hypothetical protein
MNLFHLAIGLTIAGDILLIAAALWLRATVVSLNNHMRLLLKRQAWLKAQLDELKPPLPQQGEANPLTKH